MLEAEQALFLSYAGIELDWETHRVRAGETRIYLSPLDIRLLRVLMTSPRRVFSREEILREVWPRGIFVSPRTVDVHIATLRGALNRSGMPTLIRTVRSRGYSLDPEL